MLINVEDKHDGFYFKTIKFSVPRCIVFIDVTMSQNIQNSDTLRKTYDLHII